MFRLRSPPTPERLECDRGSAALQALELVAILTDPGGPVLLDDAGRQGGVDEVAILTDPGGPVLPLCSLGISGLKDPKLRSSPTPEGVRGHVKVAAGGRVEVTTGGQF